MTTTRDRLNMAIGDTKKGVFKEMFVAYIFILYCSTLRS